MSDDLYSAKKPASKAVIRRSTTKAIGKSVAWESHSLAVTSVNNLSWIACPRLVQVDG